MQVHLQGHFHPGLSQSLAQEALGLGGKGDGITLHPHEDLLGTGQDPLMLLLALSDLGELLSVESDTDRLPLFAELNIQKLYLSWRVLLRTEASRCAVEDVFTFVSGNLAQTSGSSASLSSR